MMALPRGTLYVTLLAVLTMPAMISSQNEGKAEKLDQPHTRTNE